MFLQVPVAVETHLAVMLVTSVPLFIVVPILVLDLISFRGEPSSAERTLERLLAGMRPLVKLQICQVVELNAAYFNSVD